LTGGADESRGGVGESELVPLGRSVRVLHTDATDTFANHLE